MIFQKELFFNYSFKRKRKNYMQCYLFLSSSDVTYSRHSSILVSASVKHASDFLLVAPIYTLGLQFKYQEFRNLILYRMCIPLFGTNSFCSNCKRSMDIYGDHAFLCKGFNNSRSYRHNRFVKLLFSIMSASSFPVLRKRRHLFPSSFKRPADIYCRDWMYASPMAFDFTCVSTISKASSSTSSIEKAYAKKMATYKALCLEQGISFMPIVADTIGAFHPSSFGIFKRIARQWAMHLQQDEKVAKLRLYQQLSVNLQQSNASILSQHFHAYVTRDSPRDRGVVIIIKEQQ